MNTRTKSGIGLIAILGFVLLILHLPGPVPEQRVLLKDGSVLIVRDVRPGNAGLAIYSADPPLVRLARHVLPATFARKHFGPELKTTVSSSPELLHLYFRYIPAGATSTIPAVFQKFNGALEVQDHHHNVRRVERNSRAYGYMSGTLNDTLFGLSTPIFPRRDKTFLLRCYDYQGTLSAEFTVTNPCWNPTYPEWKPESLPASKTNGSVKMTLQAFALKSDSDARPRLKIESSDPSWLFTSSMDDLLDDGSKTVSAHLPSFTPLNHYGNFEYWFTDVTGNTGGRLFPDEPAWKLHLRVYRDDDIEFPARAVLRPPLILIPPAQQFTNDTRWTNLINGISVQLVAVCGGGKLIVSNDSDCHIDTNYVPGSSRSILSHRSFGLGVTEYTLDKPFIVVKFDHITEQSRPIIRLFDETGKYLHDLHHDSASTHPHPEGDMSIELVQSLPSGITGKVQVEIVINEPKEFEFLFPPMK